MVYPTRCPQIVTIKCLQNEPFLLLLIQDPEDQEQLYTVEQAWCKFHNAIRNAKI